MGTKMRIILNGVLRPNVYVPIIVLAILAAIPFFTSNSYVIHLLILTLFYAALSEAWNVFGGYAGQLSAGHAAFFGLGAFTSTLLLILWGISPWVGMFIGAGVAVFFGLIIGCLCFGLRGPFFTMSTIAFAEVLMLAFLNWNLTGSHWGLTVPISGDSIINFQFLSKIPYFYFILAMLLTIVFITYIIRKSQLGLYLIAIREDEVAAQSLGINVLKYKLVALTISVFFTAIMGTFYAQYILHIYPGSVMSLDFSLQIALPTIIGGMGTISGPIVGALILTPIAEFTRAILGGGYAGVYLLVYGVILVLTVLLMPRGIGEPLMKKYESALRKLPGAQK